MVSFYDPMNKSDLARVELILKNEGIGYFMRRETEKGIGPLQILVSEEDVPRAEEALLSH
ncbi:MAG: hypothetical protein HYV06_01880 [Deltaproteobacteria bacterium]|nr:hypothetical protein [Deltaproteobacteria bacterium]